MAQAAESDAGCETRFIMLGHGRTRSQGSCRSGAMARGKKGRKLRKSFATCRGGRGKKSSAGCLGAVVRTILRCRQPALRPFLRETAASRSFGRQCGAPLHSIRRAGREHRLHAAQGNHGANDGPYRAGSFRRGVAARGAVVGFVVGEELFCETAGEGAKARRHEVWAVSTGARMGKNRGCNFRNG